MKGPILAAAFVSVMLASCAAFREARMHDARIEQLTRDYVAGRISMQRYHDLCNVVNGGWRFVKADGASASSTTDDTSTSTTSKADNLAEEKKKGDIAHENKAPPPATPPSPPPR